MFGGISYNPSKISFKEASNPLNNFIEKPLYPLNNFNERTMNIPKVNIKNIKSNVNNNNYTDADSLVEYFHGMLMNYISLEKSKGKLSEDGIQLEKLIIDYNKEKKMNNNTKINGGEDVYDGITYTEDYNINVNVENNYNDIEDDGNQINIIYKYYKFNDKLTHSINIEYIKKDENTTGVKNKLIIDLNNGNIYEVRYEVFKNVYTPSRIINQLLEIIINKLIILNINDIRCRENRKELRMNDKLRLHQSTLSLLIMILSFRNNMNKDIYKKYNYARYLNNMYEYFLNQNCYKFSNNNSKIILTYNVLTNKILKEGFGGDCVLNTITCVKYKELHKLLAIKINMLKDREIKNYKWGDERFCDFIKTILYLMDEADINGHNGDIIDYIDDYSAFLKGIDEYKNYTEYENLKNNYKNNSTIIISLLKGCIKFNSAIRSILIDYGAIDELKNCVYNNYDESYRQKIYNLIKYFESETFKDNLKNKIEETNKIFEFYYDIIKNYNANIFYINLLISLHLTYYKVNYLFDEEILKFYNYDDKRKYAINRFRNVCWNYQEADLIRYNYYKHDKSYYKSSYINNAEYFFSVIHDFNHATLFIIEVNPYDLSKKYHVLDLNDLNFTTFNVNAINPNIGYKKYCDADYFNISFGPLRYTYYYYDLTLEKFFKDKELWERPELCMDIKKLEQRKGYNHYANFFQDKIMENNHLIKYINKYLKSHNITDNYDMIYRLKIININNKDDYEFFKDFNVNLNKYIKYEILKDLMEINYSVLVNKEECIVDNLLYYFIDFLYYEYFILCKDNLDINTFYSDIIENYHVIKLDNFDNYFLPRDEIFKDKVSDIIKMFAQLNILNNLFSGGKLMIDSNNNYNSIIKKVLIILLIILIIIIIVLIVLYIINKYKNNDNNLV